MKYLTSYLLTAARVPDHFYALVKGLSGREATYHNPGTSLRSFVLSGTNPLHEFITLDDEMTANLNECVDFTDDVTIYDTINHALRTQPYDVVEKIIEIQGKNKAIVDIMKRLNSLNTTVEACWDTLQRNSPPEQLNMWSMPASDYKQAIINLKMYTSELVNHLEDISRSTA